jgi:hypothetical protein
VHGNLFRWLFPFFIETHLLVNKITNKETRTQKFKEFLLVPFPTNHSNICRRNACLWSGLIITRHTVLQTWIPSCWRWSLLAFWFPFLQNPFNYLRASQDPLVWHIAISAASQACNNLLFKKLWTSFCLFPPGFKSVRLSASLDTTFISQW